VLSSFLYDFCTVSDAGDDDFRGDPEAPQGRSYNDQANRFSIRHARWPACVCSGHAIGSYNWGGAQLWRRTMWKNVLADIMLPEPVCP
jgi:hypothetical protein